MDRLTDQELLIAARTDVGAFDVFYRRHVTDVQAFFRHRTADVEAAFDLTAETFAVALQSVPRYQPGPEPARAWLYGIARNMLHDALRKGRVEDRARRALAMEPIVLDEGAIAFLEAEVGGPALAALAEIPAEQRRAVAARHLDGGGYAEIARHVGCSESVVRQRVSRGLRTLQARLQEKLGDA